MDRRLDHIQKILKCNDKQLKWNSKYEIISTTTTATRSEDYTANHDVKEVAKTRKEKEIEQNQSDSVPVVGLTHPYRRIVKDKNIIIPICNYCSSITGCETLVSPPLYGLIRWESVERRTRKM